MSNELKGAVQRMISELHADTTVSLQETLDNLTDVKLHVDELIEAVEADIKAASE